MDLTRQVAVVTGGTEGIGFALATALAREGARVAICARTDTNVSRAVAELRQAGHEVTGMPCDVSSEQDVARFAELVVRTLGPARILVNNAGLGYFAPIQDISVKQFDEMMAVNVRGMFLVTRAFLGGIRKTGGSIVNIASLAGRNGFIGGTAYTASKHAVLGFSKSLMLEVRKDDVRVIAVCPGSVATPFFGKQGQALPNADRVLMPEDVAESVVNALKMSDRAMISELDIRPTNP